MPGLERRRRWNTEERLRILTQSVAPGSSPTLTCRVHGISSGRLYTWRKQFREGALTGFVPVSLAPESPALSAPNPAPASPMAAHAVNGIIEVELPAGARLRVPSDANEAALRRILPALS